ncbi:unnamed protein product, partial [Meganyctiphanes norvegica]
TATARVGVTGADYQHHCTVHICCKMIIPTKVFFLLVCGVCCCLGDRVNDRRWAFPVDDSADPIFFPGSSGRSNSHSHSPAQHLPSEPERQDPPAAAPGLIPTARPACARDLEFDAPCEHDEEYDTTTRDRIEALIHQRGGANNILRNPVFKALNEEVYTPEAEISGRIPGGRVESPVCVGVETIFFPERAKTLNNDWAFVLNQGEIKQGIKYEKCISNGTKCALGAAGSEVETVCRQKYIYKKMLVMDGQGSKILPESVLMPSCCVCYIVSAIRGGFGRVAASGDGLQ